VQGGPRLFNPYEIILVDAKRHPHVDLAAANAFIDWLISEDGRKAIADHRMNGEQAFAPAPAPIN